MIYLQGQGGGQIEGVRINEWPKSGSWTQTSGAVVQRTRGPFEAWPVSSRRSVAQLGVTPMQRDSFRQWRSPSVLHGHRTVFPQLIGRIVLMTTSFQNREAMTDDRGRLNSALIPSLTHWDRSRRIGLALAEARRGKALSIWGASGPHGWPRLSRSFEDQPERSCSDPTPSRFRIGRGALASGFGPPVAPRVEPVGGPSVPRGGDGSGRLVAIRKRERECTDGHAVRCDFARHLDMIFNMLEPLCRTIDEGDVIALQRLAKAADKSIDAFARALSDLHNGTASSRSTGDLDFLTDASACAVMALESLFQTTMALAIVDGEEDEDFLIAAAVEAATLYELSTMILRDDPRLGVFLICDQQELLVETGDALIAQVRAAQFRIAAIRGSSDFIGV